MSNPNAPIAACTKIVVVKGCRRLNLPKGTRAVVHSVTPLGAEYSHMVEVVFLTEQNKTRVLYARHINRMGDSTVNLNNGDPTQKIVIARRG